MKLSSMRYTRKGTAALETCFLFYTQEFAYLPDTMCIDLLSFGE